MADSTISGLPAGAALSGSELFPAVQGGVTVKVTANQISSSITLPATTLVATVRHIAGFMLSCGQPGAFSTSVLTIASGQCSDSTGLVYLNSTTTWTKSTAGAWAAGTGGNGMGAGLTIAASTTYYVYAILVGGAIDYYFDTSFAAANIPPSATNHQIIGCFATDGSANILPFRQIGQYVEYYSPPVLVNNITFGGSQVAISGAALPFYIVGSAVICMVKLLVTWASSSAGDVAYFSPNSNLQSSADAKITTQVANLVSTTTVETMAEGGVAAVWPYTAGTGPMTIQIIGYYNPYVSAQV